MGVYTTLTRRWLENRYRSTARDGIYLAHQPIYGRGVEGYGERGHVHRLARQYQILEVLNHFHFTSFLDVGASEGFTCHLVRRLFGADVLGTDISAEACKRSSELFDVDALAADGSRLPFFDDAFDVVVCTEVLEHIEFPVETLLELRRVARRVLVVTTDEVRTSRAQVEAHQPPFLPHIERNLFHPDDFRAILDPGVALRSQFQGAPPSDLVSDAEAAAWIRQSLAADALHADVGALVLDVIDGTARSAPRVSEERLMEEVLKPHHPLAPPTWRRPDEARMIARCVCPRTGSSLQREGDAWVATEGGRRFSSEDGIPMLCLGVEDDPSVEELATRGARLWPEDPARQAEVLTIRRRLDAPDPTAQMAWSFDDPADREAWRLIDQLEVCEGEGLSLRSTGNEPWMLGPAVDHPNSGLFGIEVEMAVRNVATRAEGPFGQVYWIGPCDFGFSEDRAVGFPVIPDGTMRRYRIDLATPPNPPGQRFVFLIRFDPLERAGDVVLRSFRFLVN